MCNKLTQWFGNALEFQLIAPQGFTQINVNKPTINHILNTMFISPEKSKTKSTKFVKWKPLSDNCQIDFKDIEGLVGGGFWQFSLPLVAVVVVVVVI